MKIKYTNFGYIESDNPSLKTLFNSRDLFGENLFPSTTIKSIKLWFGSPPGKQNIKALLGMKIKYKNYITGEKKETKYQGAKIEGENIDVRELEIPDGQYLSKFDIIYDEYITYIRFGTEKKSIIFGYFDRKREVKCLGPLNSGKNIIINIKGFVTNNGIRSLGCDYISYKDFFLNRTIIIFKLRYKLKHDTDYKLKWTDRTFIDKLDPEMKLILNICKQSDTCFQYVVKYL